MILWLASWKSPFSRVIFPEDRVRGPARGTHAVLSARTCRDYRKREPARTDFSAGCESGPASHANLYCCWPRCNRRRRQSIEISPGLADAGEFRFCEKTRCLQPLPIATAISFSRMLRPAATGFLLPVRVLWTSNTRPGKRRRSGAFAEARRQGRRCAVSHDRLWSDYRARH